MKENSKNVKIQAAKVTVNQAQTSKNKRNKIKRRRDPVVGKPPAGIQSGLAFLTPEEGGSRSRRSRFENVGDVTGFSEQAIEFIHNYVDPCGEHIRSTDAARVPDGALDTSMGGYFRAVDTIKFPWQEDGITNLEGKTYSMLWLQPPLFRALAIVLTKENDGEFSSTELDAFCASFATIKDRKDVFYPSWEFISTGFYFTVIDADVMRSVLPPNEAGVSNLLQKYRFTALGLEIFFNTPDLLNQATYTSMRYPTDQSVKTFEESVPVAGGQLAYLPVRISYTIPTFVEINNAFFPELPVFNGLLTALPSPPFVATASLRNAANTFTVAIGNSVQYRNFGGTIQLLNITTGSFISLIAINTGPLINTSEHSVTRLYLTGGAITIQDIEIDFTLLSLPPVTQAEMAQQDVKCTVNLAKETGGVYLPAKIFQPIFEVTAASSYRKILFTTDSTDVMKLTAPSQGWFDTVDQNFSFQAINWQSVPYACKPLIKIVRSNEIVPSPRSILGIATTGCPPEQYEAIEIAKAFSQNQPHGYPTSYNGLGILFAKVLAVTEAIPDMLRTGHNICREVKKICDHEVASESASAQEADVLKGFKRLMSRY